MEAERANEREREREMERKGDRLKESQREKERERANVRRFCCCFRFSLLLMGKFMLLVFLFSRQQLNIISFISICCYNKFRHKHIISPISILER